jgi:maleate cis-trans isomerase
LEDDTQKPVVSSTAASLWWVMQTLGIKARITGYGKLLNA